jgi:RHS repeat-associated protein
VISETKYTAWGEVRYSSSDSPTNYTYTGQYSYVSDFGLHFYNARWYDTSLSRFAQADSIIPAGVQGLDRYAYTFNNPIVYVDPTGHMPCQASYCDPRWYSVAPPPSQLSSGGVVAWNNLQSLGLLGNSNAAMNYVVAAEFNTGIVNSNVMISGTQANSLFQGMTNKHQEYCQGSMWSASCLNNFWAYHEPVLKGSPRPTNYDSSQEELINNLANAIQILGVVFGEGSPSVQASTDWDGCLEENIANICHYALTRPDMDVWLNNNALYDTVSGTWSYQRAERPSQILYAWNNQDSNFVTMSQDMYDLILIVCPTCVY